MLRPKYGSHGLNGSRMQEEDRAEEGRITEEDGEKNKKKKHGRREKG